MAQLKGNSNRGTDSQRNVDNSAKTLLANIRFMRVDDPVRTVVITSAIPNEGKTFVAANLARAMATSGIKTLLIETDMRRRSMAHTLHTHAQHGLYSVMSGEVALHDAVVATNTPRLHFLDAEPHIPNPSDLLASRRFSALVEQAKQEYGYIVFDTPPVSTFVDAVVLGAKSDALFLVVREQFTRKDEIARATEQLKTANVQLSGIVMNYCSRDSSDYYYYDYYYREQGPMEDGGRRRGIGLPFSRKRKESTARRVMPEVAVESPAASVPPQAPTPQNRNVQESRPATPNSWSNAPDLSEDADAPVEASPNQEEQTSRPLRSVVPSIGETGMMSRDAIDERAQQERSHRIAVEEKQRRDQANPYM